MNRDSLAACDIADYAFALDRVTALRAVDHDIIHAVDFNDGIVVFLSVVPTLRGRGFGILQARSGRGFFSHQLRRGFLQHLAGGELAVTEARIQVVDLAQAVFARYTLKIGLLNSAELDPETARFLFEILLADFDGPLALILVDDVLDLVFRAGSLDYGEPVFAGLMAGLREDIDNVSV